MIIVKIWGGLGNQLFQYSFGKYLAARLGAEVKYDIQVTNTLNSFTQRDLAISFFNVEMPLATPTEVNQKKYFSNIHLARLERKMAQHFPALLKTHIVEPNEPSAFDEMQVRDNCYYEGYWQAFKYVQPVDDVIRRHCTLAQPSGQPVADMLAQITASNSVSIHVRRGDYLNHKYLPACSMSYYQQAMSVFTKAVSNTKFFIFTDDIAWCRENFTGSQYVFVTGNQHFEDMYLMSSCRHNIIANSTFSWWGAWLNSNPEKMVVAPGLWHTKQVHKSNDLLPESWIKIG